jgi:hypothetical protein
MLSPPRDTLTRINRRPSQTEHFFDWHKKPGAENTTTPGTSENVVALHRNIRDIPYRMSASQRVATRYRSFSET